MATLLFRYFYNIFGAEKVEAAIFSNSHGFDLLNLGAKSSVSLILGKEIQRQN